MSSRFTLKVEKYHYQNKDESNSDGLTVGGNSISEAVPSITYENVMRGYPNPVEVLPPVRHSNVEWEYGNVWEDTGCDISSSCLKCPLVKCKHDDRKSYRSYCKSIGQKPNMTL